MKPHTLVPIPPSILLQLSPEPRACIERLVQHTESIHIDLSAIPKNKLAAVLVLLYEQAGELHVVLTTRSKSLRTHAGQTACPGGRLEDSDEDLIATAYREANEEISLPLPAPPDIPIYTITTLEPFISLHRLVVTPVIALLLKPEKVLPLLKAQDCEVAAIFDHPLRAIQDPDGYFGLDGLEGESRRRTLSKKGTEDWIYDTEFHNTTDSIVPFLSSTEYRMHRFRSRGSPVKGLTADILIKTAEFAFGEPMAYERYAATQIRGFNHVLGALERTEREGARDTAIDYAIPDGARG